MATVDAEQTADVEAAAVIPAAPEDVFAFLSDLQNHWRLADRFVEVVALESSDGGGDGGTVRVRGPLGVRRTATTRVVAARDLPTGQTAAVNVSGARNMLLNGA